MNPQAMLDAFSESAAKRYERDLHWKVLSLRIDAGDIPTRAEIIDALGAGGPADVPTDIWPAALAILGGQLRPKRGAKRLDVGTLMAQTACAMGMSFSDRFKHERSASLSRWAYPKKDDPHYDVRLRLRDEYKASPELFEAVLQHLYPDATP